MDNRSKKPILLLVDGHSLAFRSYYAFSKNGEGGLATKEGTPTSVTYGFLKALLDNCKTLGPQGVGIAFDTAEPTFRHKADDNYKANREIAPEIFFQDLEQLQGILEEQLNLPLFMAPGFEADDVLGTLANKGAKEGWSVRILTGDRDLFQLVNDTLDIAVLYMGGGPYAKNNGPICINEEGVLKKLGVSPEKVVDLKALTGDSSDNIQGVKGVGPKTAINLLSENENLEGIYTTLDKLVNKGSKASKGSIKGAVIDKLMKDRSNAFLSRFLAEIRIDVPIKMPPSLHLNKINIEGFRYTLESLELYSLVKQLTSFESVFSKADSSFKSEQNERKVTANELDENIEPSSQRKSSSIPVISPQIITSESELEALINTLMKYENHHLPVSLDTETTDLNPFKAELVGIGFCWGEGKSEMAYIPIGHRVNSTTELNKKVLNQLQLDDVISSISPWLASNKHPKTLQNAKYDRLILLRHGLVLNGVVIDTLLADYLCDSTAKHNLESIAERELGFKHINFKDIVKKGETFANTDIEIAAKYCGFDVYLTRLLAIRLKAKLMNLSHKMLKLLEEVEQPLESVLAFMEATGVRIDIPYLQKLSAELNKSILNIEQKVQELAGISFNLSSPKQLGQILFETLKLNKRKSRKTKTGWSTDANVLEKLENDHPIVPNILEYRVLSKLRSTYVEALPNLVEKETGRVHTDFNQAVTTTGRLSSSNPNLQNIPIRTEFSKRIRKAFLPQEGWRLLSADYSQIELRILAHLSEEEVLQEAFQNGDDVHALTAKLLLEKTSITNEERRLGKTLNFGVFYGMGAQRFARSTGLSQSEAKEFLDRFRMRYPKVFKFLELQEKLALSLGYVETFMGRRRYFHFDRNGLGRLLGKNLEDIDLQSAKKAGIEAQQLRAAANAPIQGSCADIIKIAMVKLHQQLVETSLPSRLLLQVHDELVLEVDPSALNTVRELVIETMEQAVTLSVPLVVDTGEGENWMELK